jgi:PucR family transcriptional regulator, purine catabolism regulatory protein
MYTNHMQLTLREALLIQPLNRAKVLAGHSGLDNIISSVNVMEVPDIVKWVHPGELLVTTMYPLHNDIAKIMTLLPQLSNKGLAGIAIKPLRYIDAIPQSMKDDANRLGFPLLELPQDISFIDIILPITGKILELKTYELIRSETIHRQFLDLVLTGGGFNEIAKILHKLIKSPIYIIDRFNKILASSLNENSKLLNKQFIEDLESNLDFLTVKSPLEIIKQWDNREPKLIKIKAAPDEIDVIECPIMVGLTRIGTIIAKVSQPLIIEQIDLITIEHASTIAALKMMELRSINQIEERLRNEVLNGLIIEDQHANESAIVILQEQTDINRHQQFLVINVGVQLNIENYTSYRKKNIIEEILYTTKRYIKNINPQSLFWYKGYKLVVYLPITPQYSCEVKNMHSELEKICGRIKKSYKNIRVFIGVSGLIEELRDFHKGYYEALRCLEVRQSLINNNRSDMVTFDNLGIFRIISIGGNRTDLQEFYNKTLGPLIEYDQNNNTELTETLRIFMENNMIIAKAAKILLIHYNTLRYRLNRIKDILGEDIFDNQNKIAIEVAFQINPMIITQ